MTGDFNDGIMILLYRAITSLSPLGKNVIVFEKWPFTEILFGVSSHVVACFALGLLQLLFTAGTAVFMSVTCFLGL